MGTSATSLRHTPEAALLHTPLGWVCLVARDRRVIAASLAPTKAGAAAVAPADCTFAGANRLLCAVMGDLRRYFRGEPVDLSRHPVDVSGQPPFLRAALLAARGICYGQVRTYGWLAGAAGTPKAARAAGQAMSRNPIPLLIPCHRVVGAGGRLTGFGGGLPLKRALLELEGVACDKQRVSPGSHRTAPRRGR
jgi:methylated-DNA-[protein]-cysteine S-methyltransferase